MPDERDRYPIRWGGGLDRASGVTGAPPTSWSDLCNVDLLGTAAEVRKGLVQEAALTVDDAGVTAMTDVVALHSQYSNPTGGFRLTLGYHAGTKKLQLWQNGAFQGTVIVFPNPLAAAEKSFFVADIYRKAFIAQDCPYAVRQLQTQHCPTGGGGPVVGLTANLDGAGVNPVFFRGVRAYLNYMVGWGFGSNADPDRPDVIRISLPGQPTVFNREHYLLAGGGGVLNCVPVGGRMLVFKENEIRPLIGSNRANFGIGPAVEPVYGLAGSQLVALSSDGTCYYWSRTGPRATAGGASWSIGLPLKLDAPEPAALVASGLVSQGFACYVPGKEQIKFVFGRRGYVYHLQTSPPSWSYDDYAVALRCASDYAKVVAADLPGTVDFPVMFGRSGGGHILTAGAAQDDNANFGARAVSVPVAPAGASGECSFSAFWLTVTHTMAVTLRVTPFVDGVAYAVRDLVIGAKGTRTTETLEIGIADLRAQTTTHPRGTWFHVKVETIVGGASAIAAGDLLFDESAVEYEVLRETRKAL